MKNFTAILSFILCLITGQTSGAKEDIKVSVVIPVYNSEQYLKPCVESLLNQTLKDIEFIFINDGSTDGSLKILEDYAKKNKSIKIYSTENHGVGSARNLGIEKSQGKYIGFVDSDDFVNKYYFAELYRLAEKHQTDIAATPNVLLTGDQEGTFITGIDKARLIEDSRFIYANCGGWAQWNKIYKKDFLSKHNIKSTTYKSKVEDVYFTTLALMNTDNIAIAPMAIYYYRIKIPKTTEPHRTDFNRIYIYKDILKYLEQANLTIEKQQQWKELINTIAKPKDIDGELQMIENEEDRQTFQKLCNQYLS